MTEEIEKIVEMLQDKFVTWIEGFALILPNIVIALVVLIIFSIIASFIGRLTEKVCNKYVSNIALGKFLVLLAKFSTSIIGFIVAINVLHLDKVVTSVLAGLGIVGMALGFAFQDITANFLSGIAMVMKSNYPFKVGDVVESNGILGIVEEISLRSTTIQTFQGQSVIIPNKLIYENPITNITLLKKRRIDLCVGVSYSDDLKKVEQVTLDTAKKIEGVLTSEGLEFVYTQFNSSSIDFDLRVWVKCEDYWTVQHKLIIAIKEAFDANNISIPFPIRTLEFNPSEVPIAA